MRNKKLLLAFMSSAALLAAACNPGVDEQKQPEQEPVVTEPATTTAEPTPTGVPSPTEVPYRDLGGMEIIIGNHWTPEMPAMIPEWQPDPVEKYREELMEKYNFTIMKKCVAGWGEMVDEYVNSVLEGTPSAQIYELDYRFVATPMTEGLFYDLATLEELDFSEDKWNDSVRELMTVGDHVYGMKAGASEPRGGVIFNKRLFEEAGLDPNLPYDLQASGEWTWSKFEELCEILTRDTDGDGQTDVYATVSQGGTTLQTLVASTGEDFVGEDENGLIYNNLESENVQKAMEFAVDLYRKGYEMPQPEDSQWDYFEGAFLEEKAAMQFNEIWTCQESGPYGDDMGDTVGFVMPPKPDGAESYCSYVCDDIVVIPSCYDEETASDIAFAYNLYTSQLMVEEGGEGWQDYYGFAFWYTKIVDGEKEYFTDERVADETLAYFADATKVKQLKTPVVYELGNVIGESLLWNYPFETTLPADQVKLIAKEWDALIAETNKNRQK